jgi:hypothetical protein
MNNIIIILLTIIFSIQLSAQGYNSNNMGNNSNNRIYIDVVSKAATINGDWGLLGGMRIGYNFNKQYSLGLVAHGLIPEHIEGTYINRDGRDNVNLGYSGFEAGYNYSLSDRFYLTGTMMIGAGRVEYENKGGHDYFFITEPGASINYRLTDWFGLGYSLNYRFASGVNYSKFSNASLSGWSMDLGMKFGF